MARGKEDQGSKHKINLKAGHFNYLKKKFLHINTDSTLSALQKDLQNRCSFVKNPGKSNNNKKQSFLLTKLFELTLALCICLNLIGQLSTSIWQPAHTDNFHFCCISKNHHSERGGYWGRAREWWLHRWVNSYRL